MSDREIIPPPKLCDCCQRPSAVTQVIVQDTKTGEKIRGPFSDFQEHGTSKRLLRPRFQFVAWWVRCADDFYNDYEQEEMFG